MCTHHHAAGLDRRRLLRLAGAALGLGLAGRVPRAWAGAPVVRLPGPGPMDTCPVCGMFVAKYREWVATVLFHDGAADHFDGAKDFFKYLHDMPRYARGRARTDIAAMGVTDYYDVAMVDATAALYVVGSDVLGPMGHELVPHATRADAEEFLRDHKGVRLLAFGEVTAALTANLDKGVFEP